MLGQVIIELRNHVEREYSNLKWKDILSTAGIESQTFMARKDYPDIFVTKIIEILAGRLKKSNKEILYEFGKSIAPNGEVVSSCRHIHNKYVSSQSPVNL